MQQSYQQTPYGVQQPAYGVPVQGYAVPPAQPSGYGYAPPHAATPIVPTMESKPKFQNTDSPYNDVWAAVLWIASVIVVLAVGVYKLQDSTPDLPQDMSYGKVTGYTMFAVGVATCLSVPLHYMTRHHAEQLIYFGNIVYMFFLAALSLYSFVAGAVFAGIILLLFTLFYAWWFSSVRDRIPFAALCLRTSAEIINTYKATVLNAFVWLVFQIVFFIFWSIGIYTARGSDGFQSNNAVTWVWLLFFYWTTQVLSGIVHVTTCGVVGMWYFTGNSMPQNPTLGALRRASTFSLGSICFGSLIIAILKLIRAMANQATRNENAFVRCIVMCIVNCIENLMEYFNDYAFVHVAVYGKPYVQSAKDTWRLVNSSGILAIINDQLLQLVYFMFVLGGGLVTGVLCLILAGTWVYFVLGLIIGMVVVSLLVGIVQSGVMTIFVCYAEEPMALQRVNPMFYDAINVAMAGYSTQNVA
jgi:hypothetical protein